MFLTLSKKEKEKEKTNNQQAVNTKLLRNKMAIYIHLKTME
jgi:hypothetical protein